MKDNDLSNISESSASAGLKYKKYQSFKNFKILRISLTRLYYNINIPTTSSFYLILTIDFYIYPSFPLSLSNYHSSSISIYLIIKPFHLVLSTIISYTATEFYYTNLSSSLFSLYHRFVYLLYP
jgi:hypothetical protein